MPLMSYRPTVGIDIVKLDASGGYWLWLGRAGLALFSWVALSSSSSCPLFWGIEGPRLGPLSFSLISDISICEKGIGGSLRPTVACVGVGTVACVGVGTVACVGVGTVACIGVGTVACIGVGVGHGLLSMPPLSGLSGPSMAAIDDISSMPISLID
jgi:hypothetical protein